MFIKYGLIPYTHMCTTKTRFCLVMTPFFIVRWLYFQAPYGGLELYRQRSGPLGGGRNSDPCPMCQKRFVINEQMAICAATCNYDPSAH